MTKQFSLMAPLMAIILFFISGSAAAQDFNKVDETVKLYPESFGTLKKLADKINADFSREDEKARAIYTWIALHVKYDLASLKSMAGNRQVAYSFSSQEEKLQKELQFRLDMAEKTMKSKKAVCQGYSSLYRALCDLTNLKCIDITGTSKVHPVDIGKLPKASDHMWNAVKIGADWKLVDVTWGAGSVDGNSGKFVQRFNDGYFFTSPDVFFLNHFPDDKRLLMLDRTEQQFSELPLFYGEYIRSNYEVAFPEKGVLTMASANLIPFKIIDLPETDRITYAFSSNRVSNEVFPKRNGNIAEFDIPVSPSSRGFLTIFVNNKSMVTYKIMK